MWQLVKCRSQGSLTAPLWEGAVSRALSSEHTGVGQLMKEDWDGAGGQRAEQICQVPSALRGGSRAELFGSLCKRSCLGCGSIPRKQGGPDCASEHLPALLAQDRSVSKELPYFLAGRKEAS